MDDTSTTHNPATTIIPGVLTGSMAGLLSGLLITILTIFLNEAGPWSWIIPALYLILFLGTGALAASFAHQEGTRLNGKSATQAGILAGAISGFSSGFILAISILFFFPEIGIAAETAAAEPQYKIGTSGMCGCLFLFPGMLFAGFGGWLYWLIFKPGLRNVEASQVTATRLSVSAVSLEPSRFSSALGNTPPTVPSLEPAAAPQEPGSNPMLELPRWNISPELAQAIQLHESGFTMNAQKLLASIIRQNPTDENAWLWLAEMQSDPSRKHDCIQHALKANPSSELARQMLSNLS